MLQPAGSTVHVVLEGSDITAPSSTGATGQTSMKINAALLLRAALSSPQAAQLLPVDQIDLSGLNEPKETDMKYEQLGTWSCEVTVQEPQTQTAPEGKTLRLVGAKIIFEPMPAK